MPDHIIRETFTVRTKGVTEKAINFERSYDGSNQWEGTRRARQIAKRHFAKREYYFAIPSYGDVSMTTTSGRKPAQKRIR